MASRPGRQYRLVWPDDHDFMPEVVVLMRGISIRQLLDAQRLANSVADQRSEGGKVDEETLTALFAVLSKNIASWNIDEEDGSPVPTDLDGVMSLELEPCVEILTEWLEAVAGVSPPLPGASPDGEQSEGLSLTMEPLSASPDS